MMQRLRRAMVTRSASNSASASGLSTCLVRDTCCCWSSPKPLPAPLPSLSALARYLTDGWRVLALDIQRNDHPKTRAVSMTDIILHHYEISPYSEKVRLGLGLKGLAWGSVEIPVIMPKPDLTALTGGYRKTPVLQIGADIYCDSQFILRELERRHPTPSFYPAGHGAADALAWWAEKTMFSPAAGILFAKRPDALPEGFLEDRAKFSGRTIDPAAMMAALPNLLDQLRAHFDWLGQM